MNYIGSKSSLLPFLEQVVRQVTAGTEKTFCDLFAGTGAVGRHFKSLGFTVIANDIQYYSYILNKAYVGIDREPDFQQLRADLPPELTPRQALFEDGVGLVLAYLNQLPGRTGFISSNYSPAGKRNYYTQSNAEQADAIRLVVEDWRRAELINEHEYFYLLATLLEAADQVANTASVYGAYLKTFKKSACRPMTLRPLRIVNGGGGCQVHNQEATQLAGAISCDILYLDPPYNQRQYGANYHVLETIARYDSPVLTGTTGMREYQRSDFCKHRKVGSAFEEIIRRARARHILISYNDEGLLPVAELQRLLALRGRPAIFKTSHSRFKADSGRVYKRAATTEYIHYVQVTTPAEGEP